MTFLFYLIFFICGFIWETYQFTHAQQVINDHNRCMIDKNIPGYKMKTRDTDWYMFIYAILSLIGVFSTQWLLFILILVQSMIFSNSKFYHPTILKIDSGISIILLFFIVLNKYQFHINWTQLLFH